MSKIKSILNIGSVFSDYFKPKHIAKTGGNILSSLPTRMTGKKLIKASATNVASSSIKAAGKVFPSPSVSKIGRNVRSIGGNLGLLGLGGLGLAAGGISTYDWFKDVDSKTTAIRQAEHELGLGQAQLELLTQLNELGKLPTGEDYQLLGLPGTPKYNAEQDQSVISAPVLLLGGVGLITGGYLLYKKFKKKKKK